MQRQFQIIAAALLGLSLMFSAPVSAKQILRPMLSQQLLSAHYLAAQKTTLLKVKSLQRRARTPRP
jgi:hypothetical protein